jgi:hypothetical protein
MLPVMKMQPECPLRANSRHSGYAQETARREIQALLRLETASVFSERTAPSDSAAPLASGGTGPCPFGGLIHGKKVNHKDETHRKIASAAFLP